MITSVQPTTTVTTTTVTCGGVGVSVTGSDKPDPHSPPMRTGRDLSVRDRD